MIEFHKTLSEQSVRFRYFGLRSLSQRTSHEQLIRSCFNDYDREIALVADYTHENGAHEIRGVARMIKSHTLDEAEFGLLVSDHWQGRGVGSTLLGLLVHVARQEKLRRMTGSILPENRVMLDVSRETGFTLRLNATEGDYEAVIRLQ